MTRWSLTTPYVGWTIAYWADGHPDRKLLAELEQIPGVTWAFTDQTNGKGVLKVPDSAMVTEPVIKWSSLEGVEPQLKNESDWMLGPLPHPNEPAVYDRWSKLLRPYQLDAAMWMMRSAGALLCDEMGLGKTSAAIVAGHELTPASRSILIAAPSYTRAVWRRELRRLDLLQNEGDFCALEGLAADEDPHGRWWFCHYEILEAWRARLLVPSKGMKASPFTVIADEIHQCLNPRSMRTKALLAIGAGRPVRIGLTGTPLPNRPRELWAPLTFVDGPKTWGTNLDFRIRYASAYQGDWGWLDGPPSNIVELRARMERKYIRRTKKDVVLDLPPMRRQGMTIESETGLSDEERKAILNVILRRSGHEETLRLIAKLRKESSKAKLKHTVELVGRLLEDGAPGVVVFAHERNTAEKLAEKLGAVVLHGGFSLAVREEAVRKYQAGEGPPVLVATFGALREGVTLTRANALVLHDLDWVPAVLLQTEARVHRLSQENPVTIYWMILRNSIDDIFLSALATKGQQIEETVAISDGADAMNDLVRGGVEVEVADQFRDDVSSMMSW